MPRAIDTKRVNVYSSFKYLCFCLKPSLKKKRIERAFT